MSSVHTDSTARLPEQDSRFIGSIVGYDEYCECLRNLDHLLSLCDLSQLKSIDEYIKRKDEFAVFTNLARRFEKQRSQLSEPKTRANDNFERRGLAWVMALARVEVGAMLAGFGNVQKPLLAVNPTVLEKTAYLELLYDGMRTHYLHLQQDAGFENLNIGPNRTPRQLSYIRRLIMTEEFANAFESLGGRQVLGPQPYQGYRSCCRELEQARNELIQEICDRVRNNNRQDVAEVGFFDTGLVAPCPQAAALVNLALRSGKAQINIIPAKPPVTARPLPVRANPPTTPQPKSGSASQNSPRKSGNQR